MEAEKNAGENRYPEIRAFMEPLFFIQGQRQTDQNGGKKHPEKSDCGGGRFGYADQYGRPADKKYSSDKYQGTEARQYSG